MEAKKTAALAGVLAWLKSEEESRAAQPEARPAAGGAPGGRRGADPWALLGRQTTMQMRNLLQRRLLRRNPR